MPSCGSCGAIDIGTLADGSTTVGALNREALAALEKSGRRLTASEKRRLEYERTKDAHIDTGKKAFYTLSSDHMAKQLGGPASRRQDDELQPPSYEASQAKQQDKPGLLGRIKSVFN